MLNKFSAWGSVLEHYLDRFLCALTIYFMSHAGYEVVIHSYYSRPGHLHLYAEPLIEFTGSTLVQAALIYLLVKRFPNANIRLVFLATDLFTDALQMALMNL
jgi:hypothetical protein